MLDLVCVGGGVCGVWVCEEGMGSFGHSFHLVIFAGFSLDVEPSL